MDKEYSLFLWCLFGTWLLISGINAQNWSPNDSEGPLCQNPVYNMNREWNTTLPPSNVSCINPVNVSEIQDYIMMAQESGNASIRGIGKSVAWSACGMMDTINSDTDMSQKVYFVNQTEFRSNCTVDVDLKQITCEAGARVIDVHEHLQDNNLSLPSFGSPVLANFIASCNACNHGKGTRRNPVGTMGSTIVEFDIILPNGTLIRNVSNESNSDLFNAARIAIGSLGIITRFTAQAVDLQTVTRMEGLNYNVSNNITEFGEIEDYVYNEMTEMLDEFDFIYGGFQTFRERFQMKRWYFTDRVQTNNLTFNVTTYNKTCWNAEGTDRNKPPCTDVAYKAVGGIPTEIYGKGWNHEAEFFVSEKYWQVAYLAGIYWILRQQECNPDMWHETYDWFLVNGNFTSNTGEIQVNTRWVGADNIWLSPGYSELGIYGDSVVHVGIYIPGGDTQNETAPSHLWNFWNEGFYQAIRYAMDAMAEVTGDYNNTFVRVHWGKASLRNYCQIKDDYPRMQEFREMRDELDPNGTFVNRFLRDKFQIGDTCQDKCCCTYYTCNKTEFQADRYGYYISPDFGECGSEEETSTTTTPATTATETTTATATTPAPTDDGDVKMVATSFVCCVLPLLCVFLNAILI